MFLYQLIKKMVAKKYPTDLDLMQNFPRKENQYLFHYTTYSSALGILLSRQMRLGSLQNMNDPLEFQDHIGDGVTFTGNPSNEEVALLVWQFKNIVTEKQNAVRLASFSMDMPFTNQTKGCQENYFNNLSKGWARSRMWAQYADNHKGICLVFDKTNLIKEFEETFKKELCETYCRKVNYTNNLYSLRESLSQPCDSLLTMDKIEFMFQKCEDFRDEQEFRLLLINRNLKDNKEIVSFPISNSLCGVIPGTRFPKENEASLRKAIETLNTKIRWFPIWWNYGEPQLHDSVRLKAIIDEIGIN